MRHQHRLLVAAFGALVLAGCRKDADSEPPSVRITAPVEGSSVAVPGSFAVRVEVSDDRRVERLTVSLSDADGVPVVPAVTADVGQASATVELTLPVASEAVLTGDYTLAARASDGRNDGRAFVTVHVLGTPLRVRSTFVVPVPGSPAPAITRIDSLGQQSVFAVLADAASAAADRDALFTAGEQNEPLRRWDLRTGQSAVLAPASITGAWPHAFSGLVRDPADGRFYVGTGSGQVRGFDAGGIQRFGTTLPNGYFSRCTAVIGDRVVCAAIDPVTSQSRLLVFAGASGTQVAGFPLAFEPVAISKVRGLPYAWLFGNTGSGGVAAQVDPQNGAVLLSWTSALPIAAATALPDGAHAVAFSQGVARFSNGFTLLQPALAATALAYEPASAKVLVGTGSSLVPMDPQSGALAPPVAVSGTVGTIALQLNRY